MSEENIREKIQLYKAKAKQCNNLDARDWWVAKAYALEQLLGIRPQSEELRSP